MTWVYRCDIEECKSLVVLIYFRTGELSFYDFAKNTVFHTSIVAEYAKIRSMESYGQLLRTLLEKRGITDFARAEVFLKPDYERDFHDPYLMRDMERAAVRIYEAVEGGERIVIYADYDC